MNKPKFEHIFCSQCGKDLGAGDHGISHCKNHLPMSDWTNEPWKVKPCNNGGGLLIRGEGKYRAHPPTHLQIVPFGDAARIVTCVNALAGFPDPEADVQALVEAARLYLDTYADTQTHPTPSQEVKVVLAFRDALGRLRREP